MHTNSDNYSEPTCKMHTNSDNYSEPTCKTNTNLDNYSEPACKTNIKKPAKPYMPFLPYSFHYPYFSSAGNGALLLLSIHFSPLIKTLPD